MSGRHRLLRAFPRRWRARFGDQLGHLLDDIEQESGRLRARDQLDVARAGFTERLSELRRHRRALVSCGVALSLVIASVFVVLEVASGPTPLTVSPPSSTQPRVSIASTSTQPSDVHTTQPTTGVQTKPNPIVMPPHFFATRRSAAAAAAQEAAARAQVAARTVAAARAVAEVAQAAEMARAQAAAQAATRAAAQAESQVGTASGTAQ